MLKRLKPKSEFTRNVLTLMTGTTIAQAIPIAISPILTRIYTPEDFGLFALFISVASLLSIISTGRYEVAIMLPTTNREASVIFVLSILITIIVSVTLLLIIVIFNNQITSFLGNKDISIWLYLIPFSVFFTGVYQSLNYWLNRQKNYKTLAQARVLKSLSTSGANVSAGLSGLSSAGLVLSSLIGQFFSMFFLMKKVEKTNKIFLRHVTLKKLSFVAQKYKKFPTWNLFASFINALRLNVIVMFLSKYFIDSALGFYYFAEKLLRLPSNVLISAFSDVYYQRLSKITSYDKMYNLSVDYMKRIIIILFVPYAILLFLFKPLIPIIFGARWEELYLYLYILSLPIFFNLVISHFSKILLVINRQEVSFMIHTYKLIGLIVVLGILYIMNLFTLKAIVILAINEMFWLLIGVLIIKRELRVSSKGLYFYALFLLLTLGELYLYIIV